MTDFFVKYKGSYCIESRVYAIDTVRHEFLIVDDYDNFRWVPTKDCELISREEVARYNYDNYSYQDVGLTIGNPLK